jgi:hypothetical protein
MSLVPRYCKKCGQELATGEHHVFGCPPREASLIDIRKLPELLPLPMILHCPVCHVQHIDGPDPKINWTNPPHKSHLCLACGCIWRPCDIATEGVKEIGTRGKADTWPTVPGELPSAKMDAPDGPVCWCGAPSTRESGWCGRPECDSVKSLDSLKRRCICPWGTLVDDCPEHGYLVPP